MTTLIFLTAIGCGLMAGLFFCFSNFVMKALVKLPPSAGAAAMQSINVTIINPWFLAVFMGTALSSLALVVLVILDGDRPGSLWAFIGALLYLIGCLGVTARFNIPLNDKLAAVDTKGPEGAMEWQNYIAGWMPWNHVRTASTLAAATAFLIAIHAMA